MKKQWIILAAVALLALSGCGSQTNSSGTSSHTADAETSAVSSETKTSDEEVTSEPSSEETTMPEESSTEASQEDSGESSAPLILESNTKQTSVIEFSLDNNRPFDTIEEYLETDTAKEMVRQLTEAENSSEVIRTAVFAEGGTKLVFERQLSTDFNLWLTDEFLENVGKSVEAQQDVFVALVDDLESCINKKSLLVVVRYVDPEGNILYQREFDNDRLDSSETSDTSEDVSGEVSNDTSDETSDEASGAMTSNS